MHIDRIIRRTELLSIIGLGRSTLYAMIADGRFPPPIQLSKRAVGWKAAAVQQWLEARKSLSETAYVA